MNEVSTPFSLFARPCVLINSFRTEIDGDYHLHVHIDQYNITNAVIV